MKWKWVVFVVCCLLVVNERAVGQQASPLAGQGVPALETKELHVSMFLERLLDVEASKYMHESQVRVLVSWIDNGAKEIVKRSTETVANGTGSCVRQCWSNVLYGAECCDGMFLPSFDLLNVYGLSQDREVDSEIYLGENGKVVWSVSLQGTYFQPMSFQNFPFETIDLIIVMDFIDTSNLVRGHSGVTVVASAAGPQVFKLGAGDDSPQWNVDSASLTVLNGVDLEENMRVRWMVVVVVLLLLLIMTMMINRC